MAVVPSARARAKGVWKLRHAVALHMLSVLFFFSSRRRHTRFDCDWSSDVCSSDLEFVRHKILDIVGDLSLVGRPLCGHVVAVRPSHTANCELARLIAAQMRKPLLAMQAFSPPPIKEPSSKNADSQAIIQSVQEGGSLDMSQLLKILPHR